MIAGKRKTIGVFLCKAYSVFDNAVYGVLEELSRKLDYDVVVFSTVGYFASQNEYDAQERRMFSFAPIEKLDGILMAPDTYEIEGFREALLDEIRSRAACPVVAVRHFSDEFDCTYTDEDITIRPLIRHLLEGHGLTQIAFLAGYPGHPDSEFRLAAFRREMADHGIEIDDQRDVFYGNMWYTCSEDAYRHFFVNSEAPQAVVCANDFMAVGLERELIRHGLNVPDDVIVTGYDNIPDITLDCSTLTTVEQDFETMVRMGFEELDRQIRAGNSPDRHHDVRRIPVPGKLIFGESCGCSERPQDQYRELSILRSAEADRLGSREVNMTYFTIETSAADTIEELHAALDKKKADTPMIRDFYLCLFEESRKADGERIFAEQMTDTACLVHSMRDKQDNGMPMISFSRHDLLPQMAERTEEPQVFYLTLLHQREFNYGYAVFHYDSGELPTAFFQHWSVTLSGALRNIHNRDELRRLYEERRLSSITDVLTRLDNRRGIMEKVDPQWNSLCVEHAAVGFISFDLDNLKGVNDTYGHQAGDFAIRLIAEAIRGSLPKNGIGARMGGDEFLVFLPRTSEMDTKRFVVAFEQKLRELNRREERSFEVNASCGAYVTSLEDGMTFEDCLHHSDRMMYQVKEKRREARKLQCR